MHYVARGSADGYFPKICRAAIVTEVAPGTIGPRISLCVINPTGLFFHEHCDYAETSEYPDQLFPGTWHWPERVE